jgi:glutamate/tyrosine decarboxylase-like PLP-dependent enzyme
MKYWKKLSVAEQDRRITTALTDNIDYKRKQSLGIPASKLDPRVFDDTATFLKDAPLLRAYAQNPNHIGCHTLGDSEPFFRGTQELEKETIALLAEDLLKAAPGSCDGYVASGGTEANLQAVWIYRNYFVREHGAAIDQIAILSSADTHYSVAKAANLLNLRWYSVPVGHDDRSINAAVLNETVDKALAEGIQYVIVISNLGSTMFGSIDDPEMYAGCLQQKNIPFKLHVDGAFGGFIYPVSTPGNTIDFSNPIVSSFTLDAHKMLQAPYGTGVFLIRKGLMEYVYTKEAGYVNGMDITLSGSRSGANAIAVWMILQSYGPFGWLEKINTLLYRTDWCCQQLQALGIRFFRQQGMNIITIRATDLDAELVVKYGLVPDTHEGDPQWYKIVIMDHVELDDLQAFIQDVQQWVGVK